MRKYYMENYICILIECDNVNSLGLSCQRDLFNIYNELVKNNTNKNNIHIFTNTKSFFIQRKIINNLYDNSITTIEEIIKNNINNNEYYFHISGHGYLGNDIRKIEITRNCEQIILSSGVLTDYQFNDLLVKYINKNAVLRVTVDTCHSGTFSNFCNKIIDINTKKLVTKKDFYFTNAFSISACNDLELDSCDIGDVGFGGSLTVHLLEQDNFSNFIFGDKIKSRDNLLKKLKMLKQEPILLTDN